LKLQFGSQFQWVATLIQWHAGSIAEPFYGGIPDDLKQATRKYLDDKQLTIVDAFYTRFTNRPRNGQ
jgi:hypothetical protein